MRSMYVTNDILVGNQKKNEDILDISLMILCFFIAPFFSIFLFFIRLHLYRSNIRVSIYLLSLSLGLLAYSFIPDSQKDIYRHYETILSYSKYGFSAFVSNVEARGTYVIQYLFYLISRTRIINILPFFIVSLFYLLYLISIENELSKNKSSIIVRVFGYMLFFSFFSYPFVISNLRQPLAYAIFLFGLSEYRENNRRAVFWFIVPMFIHYTGVFLLLVFLLCILPKRVKTYFMLIPCALLLLFFAQKYLGNYIIAIIVKYGDYSNLQDIGREFSVKFSILYYSIPIFSLTFLVLNRKNMGEKSTLHYQFSFLYILISLSALTFSNLVYGRLAFYIPIIIIPQVISFLSHEKNKILVYMSIMLMTPIIGYAILLQKANFGGYFFNKIIYLSNALSVLISGAMNTI